MRWRSIWDDRSVCEVGGGDGDGDGLKRGTRIGERDRRAG